MRYSINYLYYGTLFVLFSFLYSLNLYLTHFYSEYHPLFFFLGIGQMAIEVTLLVFLGAWIFQKWGRKGELIFVALSSFVFIFHLIDIILLRTMSLSVKGTVSFIMEEDFHSFMELLLASNIPLWVWISLVVAISLVPLAAVTFYKLTATLCQKKIWAWEPKRLLEPLFYLGCGFFLWDYSLSFYIQGEAYPFLEKYLSWNHTFVQPKQTVLTFVRPVRGRHFQQEEDLHHSSLTPASKPNIYLFIVESLREDFITPETAPHLCAFREENIHLPLATSSANGTQLSWFSIFFSDYPYLWAEYRRKWTKGSPAIHFLKKMGYETHLFSSSGLVYYHMDNLLFGKDHSLIDNYQYVFHQYPVEAHETDKQTLDLFEKQVEGKDGNLSIFFWDSTHFDYSWPKKGPPKFTPVATDIDYVMPVRGEVNLSLLQNNYKNAIFYIDQLFGRFVDHLKKKGMWENAIVIFCADHGEEFGEHGMVFHASHLVKEQTHIPLYCKFPGTGPFKDPSLLFSHMDIFPSIFDYLCPNYREDIFAGQSIFRERKWPYTFCARFNGGNAPYEFFLYNGKMKLLGRFTEKKRILFSKGIEILKVSNTDDLPQKITPSVIDHFRGGFAEIFSQDPIIIKEAGLRPTSHCSIMSAQQGAE